MRLIRMLNPSPTRKIISITLVVMTLLMLLPTRVVAAGDNTVPAQIPAQVTVNAVAPNVTFSFFSDANYSITTTSFVPQVPVYMKIQVDTANVIEETVITVWMFADTDNTTVGTPPTVADPSTAINFTIYYDLNTSQWVLKAYTSNSASGSSTWSIQFDPSRPPSTYAPPGSTSGTFYIVIVPGKTAAEATPGENNQDNYQDWDVVVKADVSGNSTTAQNYGYTMYFYGEVQTSTTSIDFGSLDPGASTSDPTQYTASVTVIANGYYNLTVTSDSAWTHTTYSNYQINLATSDPPGQGEFLLKTDDQVNTSSTPPSLVNPVIVTDNPSTAQPVVALGQRTSESGVSYTLYFQLKLGTGIRSGTYQGNIYVIALDGQ